MKNQENLLDDYHSIFNSINFLAGDGKYELALQLAQSALEKIYLEKEVAFKEEYLEQPQIDALEKELQAKFLDLKSKIQYKGNPYWQTFLVSLIASSVVGISLIITVFIISLQFKTLIEEQIKKPFDLIQGALQAELPKITNEIVSQIPQISNEIKNNIPKITNEVLIQIPQVSNEIKKNIPRALENMSEARINEKINAAFEKRLPEPSKQKLNKLDKDPH